ncbi:undecaprenyl diphosphate synthase family protein [Nonomuraea typhae]
MILDGNRHWAAAHRLGPVDGHREGARRLFEVVEWSQTAGVETGAVPR